MARNLSGRRALVTGAAAGIGRATALALAREGVMVEAVDRDAAGLGALVAEIAASGGDAGGRGPAATPGLARAWEVDLSRPAEVEGLVERVEAQAGPIDLLINVAGIGLQASVLQMPMDELRRLIEIDFFAAAALCQQALRLMSVRRAGQIINISSAAARRGLPGMSAYAAAKAAVHGFTQSLREEARRHGVAVSEVQPISVRTRFFAAAANRSERAYSATGWVQTPEHVAARIVACARRPMAELHTAPIFRLAYALEALAPNLVERGVAWFYRNAPAE
jgi:3-oxoacyl-[acyl-carrier protein] reductase